jgi:predicted DNA-binding transcriptional regulator AlpA
MRSRPSGYAAGKVGMKLLTTSQVAEKLQLSDSTLEDWRWKRLGPPFLRISRGCVRYDEDALEAWIQERMVHELPHSS